MQDTPLAGSFKMLWVIILVKASKLSPARVISKLYTLTLAAYFS